MGVRHVECGANVDTALSYGNTEPGFTAGTIDCTADTIVMGVMSCDNDSATIGCTTDRMVCPPANLGVVCSDLCACNSVDCPVVVAKDKYPEFAVGLV